MTAAMKPTDARRATYQDVLDAPPDKIAQVVDGELILSPRPAGPHTHAGSSIGGDLNGPFARKPGGPRGPGGWWIDFEPELHLDDDILVPDFAGWRRERMPLPYSTAYVTLPPDWVCEVLSPSTAGIDRIRKSRIYARHGVSHMWLVDPRSHTLEVYELLDGRWLQIQTFEGNEVIRARPFDAVELEMERWWIPEAPEEPSQEREEPAAEG